MSTVRVYLAVFDIVVNDSIHVLITIVTVKVSNSTALRWCSGFRCLTKGLI
jgi:hypothetical protein